jgi:hypothetical protein
MWSLKFTAGVLVMFAWSTSASAAPLPPGGLLTPVPSESFDPIPGVQLAQQTVPFVAATFSGTLYSSVIQGDPTNPFPGGLTFLYRVSNLQGPHSINRLALNGFQGTQLDVSFAFEPIVARGIPSFADRQIDGSTLGFSFDLSGAGLGPLRPGDASRLLIVQTNATSWVQSPAFVLDGFPAGATAFAPVPEPGAMALGLAGLTVLTCCWLRTKGASRKFARMHANTELDR